MKTVGEIKAYLETIAPFSCAESWDNCGILVGSASDTVSTVMPVLDVTKQVVDEAIEKQVDLLISHHPVIFDGIKALDTNSVVYRLAQHGIAVLSAHTNLDVAEEGVSQTFSDVLHLRDAKILEPLGVRDGVPYGEGRIGTLETECTPQALAETVRDVLDCGAVKLIEGDRPIRTVAVANGSESGLLGIALQKGADALVAGEVKYNVMVDAKNSGITLIDAGHFETENIIVAVLEQKLQAQFPELTVVHSEQNRCPYRFV